MTKELERFVGNACYNLAKEILNEYRDRGFNYESNEDMEQVRKKNASANLLEQLGDERYHELIFCADGLIKFPEKKGG